MFIALSLPKFGRRCFQLRRFNPPRPLCDAVFNRTGLECLINSKIYYNIRNGDLPSLRNIHASTFRFVGNNDPPV